MWTIRPLSCLYYISYMTTDVHIQFLYDKVLHSFLFLLIHSSAPRRPGQNWSSILTPFQRTHWQIQAVCLLQENTFPSIYTVDMNYQTLPLHNKLKFHVTKSILNTRGSGGRLVFLEATRCKHSKWFSNTTCIHTFDCNSKSNHQKCLIRYFKQTHNFV